MNVLLIEPDQILAREYGNALVSSKIDIRVCSDAQVAIGEVDSKLPDLVVLEVLLAGHSGIEFLHEFRSYEDWGRVPVIIHSSIPEYSFGVDQKIWDKLGVIEYFYKPQTSLDQLINAIKAVELVESVSANQTD